jgi:hypothetical protein
MAIPTLSEMANMARVKAGFNGGPFWKNMNKAPEMHFIEGWPPEVVSKLEGDSKPPTINMIDPWVDRKSGKY